MKKIIKILVFIVLLCSFAKYDATAQGIDGFFTNTENENYNRNPESNTNAHMTINGFGDEAPLDSGLIFLATTGLGYLIVKQRKEKNYD